MDILLKYDFNLIKQICLSRPPAKHSIEQYLMTAESLYQQLKVCEPFFDGTRVLFIGDDDHMSILASHFFITEIIVLEIDRRIINNQRYWEKKLSLSRHSIFEYDITANNNHRKIGQFDGFFINPPYGSKNEAFGAKLWLSKAMELSKTGGIGLIILPINLDLSWSITNMLSIQNFLFQNNCVILKIDNDLHTYEDLPDKNLRSSNIWTYYLGNADKLITHVHEQRNIYR